MAQEILELWPLYKIHIEYGRKKERRDVKKSMFCLIQEIFSKWHMITWRFCIWYLCQNSNMIVPVAREAGKLFICAQLILGPYYKAWRGGCVWEATSRICHVDQATWERISSVHFSHSVVSNSLRPHGLQQARFPCPSPTPRAYSNSCPLGRWCHPTISSSVIPFFSSLQSFPDSGSFQVSQFFASGGQSIGVSASASVLPMNIQEWFPLGWTSWISKSCCPRGSQKFSPIPL